MVSEPLVHETAPSHIMATSQETGFTASLNEGISQCMHKSLHHLVGKSMHNRLVLHTQPYTNI